MVMLALAAIGINALSSPRTDSLACSSQQRRCTDAAGNCGFGGGGGGYGAANQRDPEAVARDVALGYVTAAGAETDYLVRLDAHGDPDIPATQRLRKAAQS